MLETVQILDWYAEYVQSQQQRNRNDAKTPLLFLLALNI